MLRANVSIFIKMGVEIKLPDVACNDLMHYFYERIPWLIPSVSNH
jgi:hypothetical protein